jgi:hypothetical protein
VNLFRNADARPAASLLLDVLRQKCDFKGIALPVLTDLERYKPNLEAGWATMLAHQLPALPPVESFWSELPAFFAWLEGGAAPEIPAAYATAAGEELIRTRALSLPLPAIGRSHLEVIRFAASSRLCVDLDYQGSTRRIEPYSLRRTREGNIILHSFNLNRGEHRSYRVDRIEGARATGQTFVPRYAIELTPEGPLMIPPTTTGESSQSMRPRQRGNRTRRASISAGPTYVYECSYCGKRFNRKTQTSTLNPHKDKSGYPCSGRYAVWVDTRY